MKATFGSMVLLTSLLAAFPAAGQKLPISMKRAIDMALEPDGSIRLQLAVEAITRAQSETGQARAALLPYVDGSLSWENRTINLEANGIRFDIPGSVLQIPSKIGPFDVVDARARGSQTVFDYAAIRRYQASKAGLLAVRADGEGTRDQVAAEVAKRYLAAQRAEARLEASRANVKLAEELLDLAQNQKAAGTGTGIDITRSMVQLSNEKQLLLVAQNERRRATLELLRAMDLRLETDVELTDTLAYHPVDAPLESDALRTALESRPDWKAQQQRERRAKLSFSATKGESLPSASVYGNYGTLGTGVSSAFPTHTVGFRVDVPVFDGGRRDHRRGESAAILRQEQLRSADMRAMIDLDIRVALDSLRSATEQVTVAAEGLDLSERELAQAQRRFRAGVANSVEVTDAQNRVARARDNNIGAVFSYESARLDLGAAIGKVREFIQ